MISSTNIFNLIKKNIQIEIFITYEDFLNQMIIKKRYMIHKLNII
jgi:hypothetical protein